MSTVKTRGHPALQANNALPSTALGLRLVVLQYVSFNLVKISSHLTKNNEKVNLKNISNILKNLNRLSFVDTVKLNVQVCSLLGMRIKQYKF